MIHLQWFCRLLMPSGDIQRQRGATLIEYVLIVAVIAIAVFAGAQFGLASAITGLFGTAASTINSA
ncbi:hypothetical protein SADO_04725 [Salinisphaera dokdonensis CL-ES53]|uniref:Flp family type IVb pilin n=1 Tax=Salinisphaera dokdonensis CL-ES53 TaxID=1304272 RepID=A0ABV2AY09_9GAMM